MAFDWTEPDWGEYSHKLTAHPHEYELHCSLPSNDEGNPIVCANDQGAFIQGDGEPAETPGKALLFDYYGTPQAAEGAAINHGTAHFKPGLHDELIRAESELQRLPFDVERKQTVRIALNTLPPLQAEAIRMMFDLEGSGYCAQVEVAAKQGVSPQAVSKRVAKAMEALEAMPAINMLRARTYARKIGILGDW